MTIREKVCTFLEELEIEYQCMEHPPAMTMEDCRAVDEALGVNMCKNLFLCNRQQTNFYLLLMPGDKPFKTKDLSAQLGVARLSFASPEQMEQMLGVTPGSVSVLGLLQDTEREVQLLIDEDILQGERFA
ncbi:MAG: prolyl-tRNA synthetase associated domain-containing protein, partial [Clostridia bacterium]|nr:prolyl-tRNA synthetase associated domain-containing protein [Clostridia bacterium]